MENLYASVNFRTFEQASKAIQKLAYTGEMPTARVWVWNYPKRWGYGMELLYVVCVRVVG